MSHTVSITPYTRPAVFTLTCTCGGLRETNAIKWVLLAAQQHYVSLGLTWQGQGLLVDKIAGDGTD